MKTTPFESEEAPCGQMMSGERHRDWDGEVLLTEKTIYLCGCQVIRHEYHDGTFARSTVHHNGTVLVDRVNPHT